MPEYDETAGAAEDQSPAATAAGEESAGEQEAEFDPVAELREKLRYAPGDWYVVHSYAGYENRVKANLESR
ncbi:MAG: transcription termination/antitermination factor NusG, partial [Actinobacteria bacterium]